MRKNKSIFINRIIQSNGFIFTRKIIKVYYIILRTCHSLNSQYQWPYKDTHISQSLDRSILILVFQEITGVKNNKAKPSNQHQMSLLRFSCHETLLFLLYEFLNFYIHCHNLFWVIS
jgi:hypothetical protein